jgi:predicted RNA-binding protein YlxR (DUF448 family)
MKILANQSSPVKHVPQRTCVACRRVRAKRDLVRLARTPSGEVIVDASGKAEGRGAYICPDPACWEKALKEKQLERTLRQNLTHENRARLIKSVAEFSEGAIQWPEPANHPMQPSR